MYRKDLVHTVPTEAAGSDSVPFTTQDEEEKVEKEVEEEKVAEPYSVEEESHKQLEELQTQQPVEVMST